MFEGLLKSSVKTFSTPVSVQQVHREQPQSDILRRAAIVYLSELFIYIL